jgi:hypothetical protein
MSEQPFEPEVSVSDYGRRRREAWLQHHRESSAMAERAALEAHGQTADHRVVQAGQAGLYGHMTPEEKGAAVAARAATVGTAWGPGRPLERHGGRFDHVATAPAPARVDLRNVDRQGQEPGVSPLLAHMRGQQ